MALVDGAKVAAFIARELGWSGSPSNVAGRR